MCYQKDTLILLYNVHVCASMCRCEGVLYKYYFVPQLMEKIPRITEPSVSDVKLFRDFWMYCIIMGFSEAQKGEAMPPPSSHVSDVC